MNNIIGNNGEAQFANGQSARDLRTGSGNLHEPTPSTDPLEALRRDSDDVLERRIELPNAPRRKSGTSGGGPWHGRITKRIVLVVLFVLAAGVVSPFAWNYLQSYESTDDAQIDGHIDPLASRIDGTVIGVHVEDDDQVKKGDSENSRD
jgi:membrane fusion protein (multidrug efflux system)